jgi:hypothetical protein
MLQKIGIEQIPPLEGKQKDWEDNILKTAIWVPGDVPSFKNSKQVTFIPAGKHFKPSPHTVYKYRNGSYYAVNVRLTSSKAVHKYKKASEWDWVAGKVPFQRLVRDMEYPYRIAIKFIRGTRRSFDYNNIGQGVQDLMVENGWIPEDDCVHMKPFYMDPGYDKENPGVWIGIF